MKPAGFALAIGIVAVSMLAYTYATVGGQYSVNVHFVPPIVTQTCPRAQFWTPTNVTCALCFCMTGSLSRCIPRPGCRPNDPNEGNQTTAPTNSSTPAPVPAGPEQQPPASGGSGSGGNANATAPTPPTMGGSQDKPASTTDKPPAKPDSGNSTGPADSGGNKLRAAKPGKMRRRRDTELLW